jgi:hypothetical protein
LLAQNAFARRAAAVYRHDNDALLMARIEDW